jgi:hypothetical protein
MFLKMAKMLGKSFSGLLKKLNFLGEVSSAGNWFMPSALNCPSFHFWRKHCG